MLEEVEKLLIDVIHDQEINTNDPEEKKKLLVKALEKTCDVKENLKEKPGKSEEKGGQNQKDTDQKKIRKKIP